MRQSRNEEGLAMIVALLLTALLFLLGAGLLAMSETESKIFQIHNDGRMTTVVSDPDLVASMGIEVDEPRDRLLVVGRGQAKLGVYNLTTGERIAMVDLAAAINDDMLAYRSQRKATPTGHEPLHKMLHDHLPFRTPLKNRAEGDSSLSFSMQSDPKGIRTPVFRMKT